MLRFNLNYILIFLIIFFSLYFKFRKTFLIFKNKIFCFQKKIILIFFFFI
uniref:Uncharacterized protein n=1 Tax=Meloidogyne enterolobii TaxID=390850 RepID=A0A6V7Y9E1_MELEN|nr:unnamed protein product [Meloidogyne enterolobii]